MPCPGRSNPSTSELRRRSGQRCRGSRPSQHSGPPMLDACGSPRSNARHGARFNHPVGFSRCAPDRRCPLHSPPAILRSSPRPVVVTIVCAAPGRTLRSKPQVRRPPVARLRPTPARRRRCFGRRSRSVAGDRRGAAWPSLLTLLTQSTVLTGQGPTADTRAPPLIPLTKLF